MELTATNGLVEEEHTGVEEEDHQQQDGEGVVGEDLILEVHPKRDRPMVVEVHPKKDHRMVEVHPMKG